MAIHKISESDQYSSTTRVHQKIVLLFDTEKHEFIVEITGTEGTEKHNVRGCHYREELDPKSPLYREEKIEEVKEEKRKKK